MRQNGTKILVVDDDRRMVRTICDILSLNGYLTFCAHSGEEAVEALGRNNLSCVLMDVKMHGISGIKALVQMREMCPGLPVLLMSGYASDEIIDESRREGAYGILTKPIDFKAIFFFLSLLKKEERILLVGSEGKFSETVAPVLRGKGWQVVVVDDYGRVIEHLEEYYTLLVIFDMTGREADILGTARTIREKYPSKCIVLLCEEGEETARERIGGDIVCLRGPATAEHLADVIRETRRNKLMNVLTA